MKIHRVREGESIESIASLYGVNEESLIKATRLRME